MKWTVIYTDTLNRFWCLLSFHSVSWIRLGLVWLLISKINNLQKSTWFPLACNQCLSYVFRVWRLINIQSEMIFVKWHLNYITFCFRLLSVCFSVMNAVSQTHSEEIFLILKTLIVGVNLGTVLSVCFFYASKFLFIRTKTPVM